VKRNKKATGCQSTNWFWEGGGCTNYLVQFFCARNHWYHSIDIKILHLMEPFVCFFKFRFRVEFFDFRISAYSIVSLPTQSQSGSGTLFIFKHFPPKQHLHARRSGSQFRATTVAAESQIAQLHSQSKLTTQTRENRKIRHEIEVLKANGHAPHVYKHQIYRMTPKNKPQNLVRQSL
jgi:excinuclease UvrABC helicase subunit UvrB